MLWFESNAVLLLLFQEKNFALLLLLLLLLLLFRERVLFVSWLFVVAMRNVPFGLELDEEFVDEGIRVKQLLPVSNCCCCCCCCCWRHCWDKHVRGNCNWGGDCCFCKHWLLDWRWLNEFDVLQSDKWWWWWWMAQLLLKFKENIILTKNFDEWDEWG